MGRPNWSVAWTKRSPGEPIVSQVKVAQDIPPVPPPQVDYSLFDSEGFGGFGATTTVVYFPGDAASVGELLGDDVVDTARPTPRPRFGPGIRVPAPVPQTVSNRRRAQVAAQVAGVPIGGGVMPGPEPPPVGEVVGAGVAPTGAETTFASREGTGPVPVIAVAEPAGERRPSQRPVIQRINRRIDNILRGGVTRAERPRLQALRERKRDIRGR